MKLKIAKRSASQYEESCSSHDSCRESIITNYQLSSFHSSPLLKSCIMIPSQCLTPPKNTTQNQKSYSLKKPFINYEQEKEQDNQKQVKNSSNWIYSSQNSKLRVKQGNNNQLQIFKFKQHIKSLKFQQDFSCQDQQKQNQILKANFQDSSSDQQIQQLAKLRSKGKRIVGKILFSNENILEKHFPSLPEIPQESKLSITQFNE